MKENRPSSAPACFLWGFALLCMLSNNSHAQTNPCAMADKQIGLYLGGTLSTTFSGAHGDHANTAGYTRDTRIGNIDIHQDMVAGLNARVFFTPYVGLDLDVLAAAAEMPAQTITLDGTEGSQPKADFDFYTLSLGPVFRYRGEGFREQFNPYASVSLAFLFGSVSDVNTSPVYGQGGSSSIDGTGCAVRLGTQYQLHRFALFAEYRYENIPMKIDHIRSFSNGIELTRTSSCLLAGGCFTF